MGEKKRYRTTAAELPQCVTTGAAIIRAQMRPDAPARTARADVIRSALYQLSAFTCQQKQGSMDPGLSIFAGQSCRSTLQRLSQNLRLNRGRYSGRSSSGKKRPLAYARGSEHPADLRLEMNPAGHVPDFETAPATCPAEGILISNLDFQIERAPFLPRSGAVIAWDVRLKGLAMGHTQDFVLKRRFAPLSCGKFRNKS